MATWLKALATAFIFLTRIPMPRFDVISAEDEGRSMVCFPVVGFAIGLILLLVGYSLNGIIPPVVLAAVLLSLWAAITGGLHLDGLADSADGWLGGTGNPERTLEIMHDSRCGAGALVAVGCLLIMKFAALAMIVENQQWAYLIIAPVFGRCVSSLLFIPGTFLYTPYVQPSGIAEHFINHCPRFVHMTTFAALLLALMLVGSASIAVTLIITCLIMLLLLRRLMLQRLGGATGDTAGASTEIIETLVLIVSVSTA